MASQRTSGVGSIKHAIIERTNTFIVVVVSVTVFVVVFCAFATRSLVSQSLFQQRVISEKKKALTVLEDNKRAAESLKTRYEIFATASENVLGGDPNGAGPIDGDNPRIVLDALPSEYDYPALSSSIEKLLEDGSYTIDQVGGTEDESLNISQEDTLAEVSPVELPYPLSFTASADATLEFFQTLENSIRPMRVNLINISVNESDLTTSINLSTYYQPATGLVVTEKEQK